MSRRWVRLDAEWEESAWLDGLTGQAAGCWPRLLCWVKLRGKRGRCRKPDSSVLARRWRVPRQAVDELIAAAIEDNALEVVGDEIVVTNWQDYQEPDKTATERKRRQRRREAPKPDNESETSRPGHGVSRRDTVTRPPTPDRDRVSPPGGGDTARAREASEGLTRWLGERDIDGWPFSEVETRASVYRNYVEGLSPGAWATPDGTALPEADRPGVMARAMNHLVGERPPRFIARQFEGLLKGTIVDHLQEQGNTGPSSTTGWTPERERAIRGGDAA